MNDETFLMHHFLSFFGCSFITRCWNWEIITQIFVYRCKYIMVWTSMRWYCTLLQFLLFLYLFQFCRRLKPWNNILYTETWVGTRYFSSEKFIFVHVNVRCICSEIHFSKNFSTWCWYVFSLVCKKNQIKRN